jgi:hypothetical protein
MATLDKIGCVKITQVGNKVTGRAPLRNQIPSARGREAFNFKQQFGKAATLLAARIV